MQYCTS